MATQIEILAADLKALHDFLQSQRNVVTPERFKELLESHATGWVNRLNGLHQMTPQDAKTFTDAFLHFANCVPGFTPQSFSYKCNLFD